jgi:hypothetical protein
MAGEVSIAKTIRDVALNRLLVFAPLNFISATRTYSERSY